MIYSPHEYQKVAIQHILDTPNAGIFLTVGLGKSSITLTALEILNSNLEIRKTLVVCPKRVVHTWTTELAKWDHLSHIKMVPITGTEKQRLLCLKQEADIYVISRDNISWLINYCQRVLRKFLFDVIVLDELSNFKNRSSQRFKSVRKVLPKVQRVIGLTGTPVPNSLLSLYSQIYLLDKGERLGKTFQMYTDTYFKPGARNGHIVFNYELKEGAADQIHTAISDICISMTSKDYLDLPERIDILEEVELASYEKYADFKKTEWIKLDCGEEITPINAAAMYQKLLMFCNGAIYTADGGYEVVDNSKLQAITEDVQDLNGEPVLIFYQFKSDYERIKKALPGAIKLQTDKDIDKWNRGEISIALNQIQSIAFGVNLQYGGHHLFWFGLGWDLENYVQGLGRLDRQGQDKPVINKIYIAKNSIEQLVWDRMNKKQITQNDLMEALRC